jgi:hypothetical protein
MKVKSWLDNLSPSVQFTALSCGVFFFFGLHNLLQEAMMTIPGFKFGVMLGRFDGLFIPKSNVLICKFSSLSDAHRFLSICCLFSTVVTGYMEVFG